MDPLDFPAEAGYRVGINGTVHFAVQIHYENTLLGELFSLSFRSIPHDLTTSQQHLTRISRILHHQAPNRVDSSGIRVKVTRKLRQFDAATLRVGLPYERIEIPSGRPSYTVVGKCSASATTKFVLPDGLNEIKVFFVGLHLHLLGRRAITQHYRDGVLIGTVGEEPNYLFDNQR
jgi:hypothetical protein